MNRLKIKIGHQKQVDKPIYLLFNGSVICGKYQYEGYQKKKFKEDYTYIIERACTSPRKNILDVSKYEYWDAVKICDEIIDAKAQNSISAQRILRLAKETEIRVKIMKEIYPVFMDAVHLRWQKTFKGPGDFKTKPKNPWEIL